MVGSLSRGTLVIALLLLGIAPVRADAPISSYACAPGTKLEGVGCSCPKSHTARRDPADEGKAICALAGIKATSSPYLQLVKEGNAAADALDCGKAEELYGKALQVNPKGVEALVGSGNCMAKQSKWAAAHAQFDKALAIDPKHELALWSNAEAYRLAYAKDEAIAAYRAYLAVFPNATKAKQALTKLGGSTRPATPPRAVRLPKRTQDVVIVIAGTKITANGVAVTGNGTVADWIAIYGKPDRTWDPGKGVNKIHTWDALGFIVYEPLDRPGRATSATFLFKPMGLAFDPKTLFAGWITVDGAELTATTSIGSVKTRPGATLPYGATSVVFPKGDFNVFTTAKTDQLDLVELSMWKTEQAGTTRASTSSELRLEVAGGIAKLQGQALGPTTTVADVEKLLGKPDRVWTKAGSPNRIHIWDGFGILIYEPVNSGKARTIGFRYKPLDTEFSPKSTFKGRITLDGRGIYGFNTIGTLATREGASQPYDTDSVMFTMGSLQLFASAKNPTEPLDTVELTLSK